MSESPAGQPALLARLAGTVRRLWRRRREEPVRDAAALRLFVQTRASYVAQMTLYGYLRTRAGARFPELFDDDVFVASINIAKWHVWLACLSDLSVYAGGLLRRAGASAATVGAIVASLVDRILEETGVPADAGPQFGAHAERIRARIALCDWSAIADDDSAFCESPAALVEWAPVVEDLKQLDAHIVRNSVRFRWNEIRQELRRTLDGQALVLESAAATDRAERPL
ncbi:MAG TPA: hypothetical protein VK043_06215 [Burkholderiales bacterium]|nr:hypothetical protein [Burkholderiales bacterium]